MTLDPLANTEGYCPECKGSMVRLTSVQGPWMWRCHRCEYEGDDYLLWPELGPTLDRFSKLVGVTAHVLIIIVILVGVLFFLVIGEVL